MEKPLAVAALLLLLCLGGLRAAPPPRQARDAPEGPPEVPPVPPFDDFFSRHFQTWSSFMTQELPQKLQAQELRSQAEAYLDRANKQLVPLAQELRSNVLGFFSSLLELGKDEGQP